MPDGVFQVFFFNILTEKSNKCCASYAISRVIETTKKQNNFSLPITFKLKAHLSSIYVRYKLYEKLFFYTRCSGSISQYQSYTLF
jgi:hypothetical protein